MPKITATIVFDCDGDVNPESVKVNVEDAIARQMDNFGLSGDADEGSVTGFDIEMGELEVDRLYIIDLPDYNDPSGTWVTVGETFDNEADAIAWAKEHLGADDQGNINVISEIEGDC